jgi:hypothetical protein
VFDQYELIAAEYAQTFTDGARPFDRSLLQSFTELVLRSGGDTALDVGCGPGLAAQAFVIASVATDQVG